MKNHSASIKTYENHSFLNLENKILNFTFMLWNKPTQDCWDQTQYQRTKKNERTNECTLSRFTDHPNWVYYLPDLPAWFAATDFFDFFVLLFLSRWREISVDCLFSFWHNYLQHDELLWNRKCCVYNNFLSCNCSPRLQNISRHLMIFDRSTLVGLSLPYKPRIAEIFATFFKALLSRDDAFLHIVKLLNF